VGVRAREQKGSSGIGGSKIGDEINAADQEEKAQKTDLESPSKSNRRVMGHGERKKNR